MNTLVMTKNLWNVRGVVAVMGGCCVGLFVMGMYWPKLIATPGVASLLPALHVPELPPAGYPYLGLLKMAVAAFIGLTITAVHKRYHRGKPMTLSLEQTEMLLCISGALMMIIIGDSVARAFGVAGAASIVRFRTPVDDPKDTIIMFLSLGLGMACGLAAFGLALLATIFVCGMLALLDRTGQEKPLVIEMDMLAQGPDFPSAQVREMMSRHDLTYEMRAQQRGDRTEATYVVRVSAAETVEAVSRELIESGVGLKRVTWASKRG